MGKYNRIMEIFWLVMAFITAVMGAFIINKKGLSDQWMFALFPVLSLAMYALRRYMRKREEKGQKKHG